MANYYWENCLFDILTDIFSKLEYVDLLICMQVCRNWKEIAYYVVKKRAGGLRKAVMEGLGDVALLYRNRSHINTHDSYLNSLLWYNICDSEINYYGSLGKNITYMSIYKGNIFIVDDNGYLYYDVQKKTITRQSSVYQNLNIDECDNFVVKSYGDYEELRRLSVFIKRSNHSTCSDVAQYSSLVVTYKIFEGDCFIINTIGHILRISTSDYIEVRAKLLSRFYGPISEIAAMHVLPNYNVYVMLKTGVIMRCYAKYVGPLYKAFCIDPPYSADIFPKSVMFHFGVVFEVGPEAEFSVNCITNNFLTIRCPGFKCAYDHGNVLFLGYKDGKVDIFIKKKLAKGKIVPERTIDVYDYYENPRYPGCWDICQINVYEASHSHVLCVITNTVIVKLKIQNLELIDPTSDIGNLDDACLSIIHLLNIEV